MATAKKYKAGMTHTEYSRIYKYSHKEKVMLSYAKDRAKKKGFEFNIDETDIIVPKECPILSIPIFKGVGLGKKSGPSGNSPSLDRIDSSKGYIKGNVQVISHKANTMKHNATPEELIKFATWIEEMYMKKTARNESTGDLLQSKLNNDLFEKNFDLIFRKKEVLPEYELNKSTGEVQKKED
jgi:di/tripeptidase